MNVISAAIRLGLVSGVMMLSVLTTKGNETTKGDKGPDRLPPLPLVERQPLVPPQAPPPQSVDARRPDTPLPTRSLESPVDREALEQFEELRYLKVRNLIAVEQLHAAIGRGAKGLELDLSGLARLLDGTVIDPARIYGTAYVGPYPFEAAEARFAYKRFRGKAEVSGGKATLDVGYFLETPHNSEQWTDRGTVVARFELFCELNGKDRPLGTYDLLLAFMHKDGDYRRLPWITEGPLVNLVTSDDPTKAVVSFTTSEPATATVILDDGQRFPSRLGLRHAVCLEPLAPDRTYRYQVRVGGLTSRSYELRTAPEPGSGTVVFAYCGDSREGRGGGMNTYMGINHATLSRHAATAYAAGARFFLMGGDLVNGYTTSKEDFEGQLYAWKQAMSGFWHERPVYPAMGNHEALLRAFRVGEQSIRVDRWPYATQSAETVFAEAFINPANGPQPSDPRRPTYHKNVFSFQYGPVKLIALNNNYWYSDRPWQFGGSPEGYMFDDQLTWIERELEKAENDSSVAYVLLYAQEPVFPCGGHVNDAMWWNGNNCVRAYAVNDGQLTPEPKGIIEVRNRLARAVGRSSKVAAVLGSDEHAYYRVQIDRRVPVGIPDRDDRNGDGAIRWTGREPASPLAELKHATWYLTCGGGGAPYYSEELTPWTQHWAKQPDPRQGYYYSSQENLLLFRAGDEGISVRVVNPYGETIEEIGNLMAIKR